jgi:hypothetical protein
MMAHHNLDTYVAAYIEAAGIAGDKHSPLFRTLIRKTNQLTDKPMPQSNVYRMIRKRRPRPALRH